jgi:FixJ family two-component response regulator
MLEVTGASEVNACDFKPANEIFVVDDNEGYRELLAGILELEGFDVSAFPEGTSFLKQASSRVPVCVFLDIVMPGPSGLDVLKKLNERSYAAPIFLISARNDSAAVVEGMKYGAQDFIEKPFDPYTAVLRVRDAVDIWSRRAEKAAKPDVLPLRLHSGLRLSRMERDVLQHIVAGNDNVEVSKLLGISKQSVATHRWRITKKFGARNSADLVRIVLSNLQSPSGPVEIETRG